MKKSLSIYAAATAATLVTLTGCSGAGANAPEGRPEIRADYATYASTEEITTVSDIAVTGSILGIRTKECDKGGDPTGVPTVDPTDVNTVDPNPDPSATVDPLPASAPPGIIGDGPRSQRCLPMVFLRVRVSGMMKRGFGVAEGDEIIVGNIDTDAVNMEGASPITVGQQYALYLRQLTAGDHPGITSVPTFWVPVGGNQGVYLIRKGSVTPASASVVALTAAEAEQLRKQNKKTTGFTTTVEGLRKAAKLSAANHPPSAR